MKDRKLDVLVGYVTRKGLKVAQFRNDQGAIYTTRVSLIAGSNEEDCTCSGFADWGQVCYHLLTLEAMSVTELLARNVANPVVETSRDLSERGSFTHTAEQTASAFAFISSYRNKAS